MIIVNWILASKPKTCRKDLANFTFEKKKVPRAIFHSLDVEEVRKVSGPIIHWIPKNGSVPVELTLIDGSKVMGLAEPGLKEMSVGTFLQFEWPRRRRRSQNQHYHLPCSK